MRTKRKIFFSPHDRRRLFITNRKEKLEKNIISTWTGMPPIVGCVVSRHRHRVLTLGRDFLACKINHGSFNRWFEEERSKRNKRTPTIPVTAKKTTREKMEPQEKCITIEFTVSLNSDNSNPEKHTCTFTSTSSKKKRQWYPTTTSRRTPRKHND